ncbi:GNAT family N-acetyltransferase [Allokutzneria oryzae]|uniref:GNAT family N-acetyltransferase n=1 Tax=Allokutzneria oryzae TaxID=1378989 RepID=A0ABV6A925_9PSEU
MLPDIREATPADIDAAVATLQAAFIDYPLTRHTLPDDGHPERLAEFQRLLLTDIGLPHGRIWVSSDHSAVAMWTTPATDAAAFAALGPRLGELAGDRAAAASAVEQVLAPHRPATPTWFLSTVGVHPASQGRGLGRAVIEPGLRAADAENATAYLETALESNVRRYERFGFTVTAEVALPDNGPTAWTMHRPPQ